jgi:hypothetical protein
MRAPRTQQKSLTPLALGACPCCQSAEEVLVAFSTRAVLYLICGRCEHTWRTPATESGAQDVWTSAAFRISRNMTGVPGSSGDAPRGPMRLRQTGDVPRPRRRPRGNGQS